VWWRGCDRTGWSAARSRSTTATSRSISTRRCGCARLDHRSSFDLDAGVAFARAFGGDREEGVRAPGLHLGAIARWRYLELWVDARLTRWRTSAPFDPGSELRVLTAVGVTGKPLYIGVPLVLLTAAVIAAVGLANTPTH
jgi:hypothetical protein